MLRTLSLLFLILTTSLAYANCDFKTGQYVEELGNPKNIDKIIITVPKNSKWQKNARKILLSSQENIPPKLKKNFKAKFEINYTFGSCTFWGSIRQNGDFRDHILLSNDGFIRSLNAKLDNGNILKSVKFKLLIPQTRNGLNEVFGISVLNALDFITPETFYVDVSVNGINSIMLFQETASKELLERNYRREGPLFEGDETILWSNNGRLLNDDVSLSRLENKNWFLKGASSQEITLRAFSVLQSAYIIRGNNTAQFGDYIDPNTLMSFAANQNLSFPRFHFVIQALNAEHALISHNRKFYYNFFNSSFEPIYYDGEVFSGSKKFLFNTIRRPFEPNILSNAYNKLDVKLYGDLIVSDQIKKKSRNYFVKRSGLNHNDASQKFKKYWKIFSTRTKNLQNEAQKAYSSGNVNISQFSASDYLTQLDIFLTRAANNPSIEALGLELSKKPDNTYFLELQNQQRTDISTEELANILAKNNLRGTRTTLLVYNQNNKTQKTIMHKFLDGEIIASSNLKVFIDRNNNTLKFEQDNSNDWVLLKNLSLEDWNIEFVGSLQTFQAPGGQRFNNVGMTGCLNFYNNKFTNVNISVSNGGCEDSLNIVNSQGTLGEIKIINAFSDAVDIDFSNISIQSLFVNNAGNDCFDVSSGHHEISKAKLHQCGDKGISVGEASFLNVEQVDLLTANIGISSKDYSRVDISNAEITNVKVCIEAKQKKQEFGGAVLQVGNFECDGVIEVDKHSEFKRVLK
jgi:hypothetical protein